MIISHSCKKEIGHLFGPNDITNIQWAKDYYATVLETKATYGLNLTASMDKAISAKNRSLKNTKRPNWAKASANKTSIYDYVEIPISYDHKITPTIAIVANPDIIPIANQQVIDASFDRLVIYRDKKGRINQRIISFVPDEAYLKRHKNNIGQPNR